ncbi:DedA family protein [Humibacillus xanthopallidus]|uniref:Membrane protein DedA with SNARE-associated domain n=1 Tax=Humibacillus xanthopallidus TaxID=412689 RepID=A0A543I2I0_9MICO|nr:VTT domain-containing protein [Humibacillus xanthopallidus]TQM64804.1 membrane protein DedA with SNARE-associated domain [Humibacillus xanthopallidus]
MLDRLAALPFWQAFAALFVIVMARSNATYWVGRGAVAGWRRYRGAHGELTRRAESLLRSLGPLAVTLSYLTIGIQTAVHLTAGVMRMPLRFYVPAAVVGSAAWAAIYATIGLAVVQAWIAAEAGSWWGLAVIVAVLGAGIVTWVVRGRRREPETTDPARTRS